MILSQLIRPEPNRWNASAAPRTKPGTGSPTFSLLVQGADRGLVEAEAARASRFSDSPPTGEMEMPHRLGPLLALQRVVGEPLRVQGESAAARVFHGGQDSSM